MKMKKMMKMKTSMMMMMKIVSDDDGYIESATMYKKIGEDEDVAGLCRHWHCFSH